KIAALNLLKKLKKIENEMGRVKTVRFGPRLIDLDILLYGDQLTRTKALTIPHPRMFTRDFVIKPLVQVL
ncbi:MAG: 2-amino-4-hydroxy-6-hydroxymethyldihydropteridine diphosphokinase, partial [Candidatus Omnitrophota bacterium]